MKCNFKKGFTLIELVIVIAILGILAGIAIPRFMDATATARGAKIVADLRTIDSALAMYQAKSGMSVQISVGQTTGTTDCLTKDDPTANPPCYKLLAAWPTPPTGTAIFPCNPNQKVDLPKKRVRYYTSKYYNRAFVVINDMDHMFTADQLAEGGDAY